MPFMLTCVRAARLCQTCTLHNSSAKRLTSNFWHIHPPHRVSMGGKSHVHLYARGIHSESVKIDWDWAIFEWEELDQAVYKLIFAKKERKCGFFKPLTVIIFWYHEQIICSLVQHTGAALNQRDLTTRWQICVAWIQSGSFGSVTGMWTSS